MAHTNTLQRNDKLIRRKFDSYLVPGVMMAVAMQLGSIMDGVFVSHLIDLDGLTAISLSFPIIILIQMVGIAFGGGSASVVSNLLGQRKVQEASEAASASLLATLVLSLAVGVASPFAAGPIARLLTPDPHLALLVEQFLFVYMAFTVAVNLAVCLAQIVNVDNCPKLAAACFVSSNVVNLVLDYVLLSFTDLGMGGSALSTILGYATGLVVVVPYLRSRKRMLAIGPREALAGLRRLGAVLAAGVPQCSYYGMLVVQFLFLNAMIQGALGPDMLAIYAVCVNGVDIVRLFIEGVVELIQTIAGVLFGERDYYGVRSLVRRTARTAAILSALLTCFFVVFPQALLDLFAFNKDYLMDTALVCVRLYSISFVFLAANRTVQVYYRATLNPALATLNTLLEGFVFLVPLVGLMMEAAGIQGVCAAVTLAEALAFGATWVWRVVGQRRGRLPQSGFLMIPDQASEVIVDATIQSTEDDAVRLARELVRTCRDAGMEPRLANAVGMACEELTVNISRYGYKTHNPCAIDVCLSRTGDALILRVRDDGVLFDPTEYLPEESGEFSLGGIELIRRMGWKMSYVRVLDMNNTIVEVSTQGDAQD